MEALFSQFIALADGIKLNSLVALILANLVLGVAVSLKTQTFRLKQVADFLCSRVLPYVLAYFAVVVIALADGSWKPLITVTWALIIAALVGAIASNLKELGVNIPDVIGGAPAAPGTVPPAPTDKP